MEDKNYTTLNQSSLSKLIRHNSEHDCAMLTAFRKRINGVKVPTEENKKRNIVLAKALKRYGYDITVVDGYYREQDEPKQTREDSFFVVNIKDDPQFKKHICDLGEEFDQDSVAYLPKGSLTKDGKEKPYLIGTSKDAVSLKYGETLNFSGTNFGTKSEIRTQINGRPFHFTFNESVNGEELLSYAFNRRGMFTALITENEFRKRAPKTFKEFMQNKNK